MKLSKEELARLYREQTRRSAAGRAVCLSNEMMARASDGNLTHAERAQVADHLSMCSECAGEYRLIRSLGSRAESQLGSEHVVARVGQGRNWFAAIWRPAPLVTALAASLMIASVTLSVWVVSLRQESRRLYSLLAGQTAARAWALEQNRQHLSETVRRAEQSATEIAELRRQVNLLAQPQLNAPVFDLDPRDPVRGVSTAAPQTLRIPNTANFFIVILNVAGQPSFPDYSLAILDHIGGAIWTGKGLQNSRLNTFTVALPRRLLHAGSYSLKLYGTRGNLTELIEDYRVIIQYE
jgi:hypothetical protein